MLTVLWYASDMALESMKPFQIMMVRFLVASVLMGMLGLGNRKKAEQATKRAGAIKAGVLMGIALFMGFSLQTIGLQYTTPSKNAFLTALNVVIVPFIAFLILKKKIGIKGIVGAVLSVIGVALLSLNGNLTLSLGDGLTLLCAVGFAFQIFLTSEFVKKYPASCIKYGSDDYRICIIRSESCDFWRNGVPSYHKRMAKCLIFRYNKYDRLLFIANSMSKICG